MVEVGQHRTAVQEQSHLIASRADQERHVGARGRGDRIERVGGEHIPVDNGSETMLAPGRQGATEHVDLGGQQFFHRRGEQDVEGR